MCEILDLSNASFMFNLTEYQQNYLLCVLRQRRKSAEFTADGVFSLSATMNGTDDHKEGLTLASASVSLCHDKDAPPPAANTKQSHRHIIIKLIINKENGNAPPTTQGSPAQLFLGGPKYLTDCFRT